MDCKQGEHVTVVIVPFGSGEDHHETFSTKPVACDCLANDLAALRAWVAEQPCDEPAQRIVFTDVDGKPVIKLGPCGKKDCPPCRERARREKG